MMEEYLPVNNGIKVYLDMKLFQSSAIHFLFLFICTSCGTESRYLSDKAPRDSGLEPISIAAYENRFDETARIIVGTDLPENSPLRTLVRGREYLKYRQDIEKSWNSFFITNIHKIHQWRDTHLRNQAGSSVFYPFSGPDILHVLSFYPDARDIVMFGLEPTGGIPDAASIDRPTLMARLHNLPYALNFTFHHAYFVTSDMQKKMGKNPFTGTTGIMMFFLSRGGYEVVSVKEIYLDEKGNASTIKPVPSRGAVAGVEILFARGAGTRLKRLRYFQLDVSDRSPQFERFALYCGKYPPFATIIKSASYLLHLDTFSKIRDLVLKRSALIIQDDTGVPYRHFAETLWDMAFYGKYHRPIPVFKHRYQPDLEKAVSRHSSGQLDFIYGYGYGFRDITYHLLLAQKKIKNLP